MATQLKPIKCPQCGSEKHDDLGEKLFRCRSCGTEFFLDDDDITIHIKHHFDVPRTSPFGNLRTDTSKKIAVIIATVTITLFFLLFEFVLWDHPSLPKIKAAPIEVHDNVEFSSLFVRKKKAVLFYIVDRNCVNGGDEETRKAKEGVFYGFKDCDTGEVLTEYRLASRDESEMRQLFTSSYLGFLRLSASPRCFIVFDGAKLYELKIDEMQLDDITPTLIEEKKPLSTGIANIKVLSRSYGEGLIITNNLSEKYYYFPQSNRLYSDEAFDYAQNLNMHELQGQKIEKVMFMLERKENDGRQMQQGNLRLWRVPVTYYPGDPNEIYDFWVFDGFYKTQHGNRIHDAQPIGKWFIGFDAAIMYQNQHFLLLKYNPIVGENANVVFQLRSNVGEVLWTQAIPHCRLDEQVVYDGSALWLCQSQWEKDNYDDTRFVRLDIHNGSVTMRDGLHTCYTLNEKKE